MSLLVPLAVVISNGRTTRHLTGDVGDVTFGWTDPGGFATAQVDLDRPITLQPDEAAYFGALTIYDARTGRVVFDGRLEDPTPSAGSSGQVWQLTAIGGQAHTRDRSVAWIYIDRDMTRWSPVHVASCPSGQRSVGDDEDIFPGEISMVHQMPDGTKVRAGSITFVSSRYLWVYRTNQRLARWDYRWDAGRTTADLRVRAYAREATNWSASADLLRDDAANTAGGGSSARIIVTDYADTCNVPEVRVQWTGAANTVGDDNTWAAWAGLVVVGSRYNKSGTHLLTAASYTASTIFAHQVVEDLLGRLLPAFDGANAVVATTTHPMEQCAYPDAATAYQILSDLMLVESGYTWRVWERNADDKFRFEWVSVPTEVRYEADVRDGYVGPGSADGLHNRVTVRWRDVSGAVRTTERTATVPVLDDADLIRQGQIDLGDEVGSLADAQRAGDQWLLDRRYPPNAGRLTIRGPVLDLETGMMVQPWEIRPGLIRVRGVAANIDALNASSRDGFTIFRAVKGDYSSRDAAMVLELDSYALSNTRLLAELRRRRTRRR